MTRTEKLAAVADALTDEQKDALIHMAEAMRAEPFYDSLPPEALASIGRGLADAAAGRISSAQDVFARLDARLASRCA